MCIKMEGIIGIFTSSILIAALVNCDDIIVSTPVGSIRGFDLPFMFAGEYQSAYAFFGIPYAESTGGSRRFTKPVEKEPFSEVFNATEMKPACLQNSNWMPGVELPTSEDCLTLNIFVPSGTQQGDSKAVMIYFYGGGFQFGVQDSYMTASLSSLYDVIYITVSYRLSAFGFLASHKHGLKGNYGLWDQHLAIKWVHENIASFGGNPDAVTIFGESAGAVAVMYQALYEGNRGYFQRVIAQSGATGAYWAYNKIQDMLFDRLAEASGCETVDCLRALSNDEMQDAFSRVSIGDMYLPVYDGEFIKYDPELIVKNMSKESAAALDRFAERDVIIGMNSHEGYGESMLLMFIFSEDMSQLGDGLSKNEMEKLSEQMLKYLNITPNETILKYLLHQYTDWSNPKSADSRRTKYLDMVKDKQYTTSTIQMLNNHVSAKTERHTYMYHFEHRSSFTHDPDWMDGANHGDEIPFVFGFPVSLMFMFGNFSLDPASKVPPNELALSRDIMKYWTQFAKTGNPNDPAEGPVEQWPEYEHTNQTYIRFIADSRPFPTGNFYRREYVNFWEELFPTVLNLTKVKDKEPCVVGTASTITSKHVVTLFCFLILLLLF